MAELTLPLILQIGGALVTGGATYMAAQHNAAVQNMNADIAEENSKRALERSAVEQQEQDYRTRGMIGEQLAAQAGSGIAVGTGSPKYTRIAARELGRLDALNIRQAGELESYGYKTQAASYRAQAGAEKAGGAWGLLGSFLNAGSLVTNAKPVAKKNYYAPVPTARPRLLS